MRSERARRPGSLLRLTFTLVAALIAACSTGDSAEHAHPGRGVYVPASWSEARKVEGHDVHVVRERVACSQCHMLGKDSIGPVPPERCAACHEQEASISHAPAQASARLGRSVRSDCTFCHRFASATSVADLEALSGDQRSSAHAHQAGDCLHCHGVRQALTPAVQIHDSGKCLDCHRPHEDATPQSASCVGCHEDVHPTHAVAGKSPNQVCTTCHQRQHALASEALSTCVPCHSQQQPLVPASALFEGGHVQCVGCHQPHEFGKTKAVACRTCHEDVAVIGAATAAGHRQCTSCHDAHDVRGSPDRACAKCHTDKHPNHPQQGIAGSCVGCHDPHPSGAQLHSRVRDCSTCHQTAAKDTEFHAGVDCQRCHAPHDFVRPASDHRACLGCHAGPTTKATALAGHQACENCHRGLPHRPLASMVSCDSCHAAEREKVSAGHAKCVGCHEPHGGSLSTACGSCHSEQRRSAPQGHQTCTNCHEPHSGSPKLAPCASCHAGQAQTKHGRLSATCNDCHRPHGPQGVAGPPSCSTCHTQPKLAGLHQVTQHRNCGRCHTDHGEPLGGGRDVCLSCHADRKQHFPEAASCASCHLFTPTR